MDRVRVFGLAASGSVVAISFAILITAARSGGDLSPPSETLRSLAVGLLLVLPAIVGFIGTLRRDRALLVAAGLGCLIVVPLSYGALPFSIPALMFLFAATDPRCAAGRPAWLVGFAVIALSIGSLVNLLTNTEERCWVAFRGTNALEYRDASEAETHEFGGPGGPIAAGCDGGALTAGGAGLAVVLGIGAVGLALVASKPRSLRVGG